jgi:hypothetical protein
VGVESFNSAQDIADGKDIKMIAGTIVRHIFNIKANQTTKKPIIVVMGEDHEAPKTQLLQYAVLHECVQSGLRPAYGAELPYDFLNNDKAIPKAIKGAKHVQRLLNAPDKHHNYIDQDFINFFDFDDALMAPLQYCAAQSLSFRFNDAARVNIEGAKRHVNIDDPLTKQTIQTLRYKHIPNPLRLEDPKAIHIRNHIMCNLAWHQLHETQSDIIIQMVGDSHVIGNDGDEYKYRHSMTHLCLKKGLDTISVITSLDEEEIPRNIGHDNIFHIIQDTDLKKFSDYDSPEAIDYIKALIKHAELPALPHISPQKRAKSIANHRRKILNT